MNWRKQQLQGSPNRDLFKRKHKELNPSLYALDLDFVLVGKNPPGIIAFVDYKAGNDKITFAEVLAYNALMKLAPVFIVQSDNPDTGPFVVYRYLDGDYLPEPPIVKTREEAICKTWNELEAWELELRYAYKMRNEDNR